jgi:DNA repair protein RadC
MENTIQTIPDADNQQSDLLELSEIEVKYIRKRTIQASPQIRTSEDSYNVFIQIWDMETIDYVENIYVMFLSRSNRVLGISKISQGGSAGSVVDVKIVLGKAILAHSNGIILAHNHPSGSLIPSPSDIEITSKIKGGAELLDITLLDHIIVTSEGYSSMADEALI